MIFCGAFFRHSNLKVAAVYIYICDDDNGFIEESRQMLLCLFACLLWFKILIYDYFLQFVALCDGASYWDDRIAFCCEYKVTEIWYT